MLADLLKRLKGALVATPLPPEDARIAVAALLVSAARVDGAFAAVERAAILDALSGRYGLDAAGAEALLADGEVAEAAATDVFRFTHLVKSAVPIEERALVLEALWRVTLADARRDALEDAFMRKVTGLLGLDDRDAALARRRVLGD